jgi:hypothetical protein
MQMNSLKPVRLFYSYAHKDEHFRKQLEKHLSLLKRDGVLSTWSDRRLGAGVEWKDAIDQNLELAEIVLLLVSADFLDSDYCYDIEMTRAMQRHEMKHVCVVPVILRPCDWSRAPFGRVQALPKDGKPITIWSNRDEAWLDVVRGLRSRCQEIQTRQKAGILIYGEQPPDRILAWPRCKVSIAGASRDELPHQRDLAWGSSVEIELTPEVEHTILAYTAIPLNGEVATAAMNCTVSENEVVQYVYRIVEQPGSSHAEKYRGRLVEVVRR